MHTANNCMLLCSWMFSALRSQSAFLHGQVEIRFHSGFIQVPYRNNVVAERAQPFPCTTRVVACHTSPPWSYPRHGVSWLTCEPRHPQLPWLPTPSDNTTWFRYQLATPDQPHHDDDARTQPTPNSTCCRGGCHASTVPARCKPTG